MNNEMICAYCKKNISGSYVTVIIDAEEQHFCIDEHVSLYFRRQDRIILEKVAQQQKSQEQK